MKITDEDIAKAKKRLQNPKYAYTVEQILCLLVESGYHPNITQLRHILAHMSTNLVTGPASFPKTPVSTRPLSRLEKLLEAWRLGQKNEGPLMRLLREVFALKLSAPTPKKANGLPKTVISKVRRFSMDPNYTDSQWKKLLALVVAGAMMNPPAMFNFAQNLKVKWSEN